MAKGDVSRVNAGREDFLEYLWQKETFLESAVAVDPLPVSFVAERNASWLTDDRGISFESLLAERDTLVIISGRDGHTFPEFLVAEKDIPLTPVGRAILSLRHWQ